MSFLAELQRRNVPRAAVLYAGAVWALAQGLAQLLPLFGDYGWIARWFVIAGAVGFPFWVAFAWFYEFTPQGLKRESEIAADDSIAHSTGRKLDRAIIAVLTLAVVLLLTNTFVLHRGVNEVAAAPAASPITAPPNSIAVLPFTNESSDKQQDYFADGIAEDLLNLLTEVQPLRVAARASSFSFKGKDLKVPEIARQLNVANVLEGSVFKQGDEVRISAQLVRASDGYQIWSHSYDRKLTDIFAIQDGIAKDVVKNLKVKLLGAVPKVRATDPKAYVLYLQARQLGRQFTPDAFKSSNALLQRALAIDPHYAPAWNRLSANFTGETLIDMLPADQGFRQAREAAGKALAIDPNYAPVHAELGSIAVEQNDLPAAVRHLQRALTLDPTDLDVLNQSANLLQALDRLPAAIAIEEYVVARDPVNPVSLFNLGGNYLDAGRYDKAIDAYRTLLSVDPGSTGVHGFFGWALLLKGEAKAALAQMQQENVEPLRLLGMAQAYHALGNKAASDAALATLIAKYAKADPYNIASVYAYRGEADLAFIWLDKAVQAADPQLAGIQADPLLDKLRADPRWLPLMRKLGRAPEQLAKIKFTVTLPGAAGASSGATSPAGATSTDAMQARAATSMAPAGSTP